jgi:hypothetical protein
VILNFWGGKMVILFDIFNMPKDVFEVIFATKQQKIVAKLLFNAMKEKNGEITKSEMSNFATALHEGKIVTEIDEPEYKGKTVKLSYNKRQFYDRILTPMKSMGMIYYDLYKRTYRLSDRFMEEISKIGKEWQDELRKPLDGKTLGKYLA